MSASNPEEQLNTTVEEYRNKDGQTLVVTTVSKVVRKNVRISKGVLERRQLPKFGICKGFPPGPEKTVTTISPDMLELRCIAPRREEVVESNEVDRIAEAKSSTIVCKNCGESGHFSLRCPSRKDIDTKPKSDKGGDDDSGSKEPEEHTVKLYNLPQDMNDMALNDLVRSACREIDVEIPNRIFLVKDKVTFKSKGFSFIAFTKKADAEKLMDRLDGHGYDNLILQAEIALPKLDRERRVFNDDHSGGDSRGEKDFSLAGSSAARANRPWRG